MKHLFSILLLCLAMAGPAIAGRKISAEPRTNAVHAADLFLVDELVMGTTFKTWAVPGSNTMAYATNVIRVAPGSGVTIATNYSNGTVTYTITATGTGGGLAPSAPYWLRYATNASYTLSTNFFLHAWTGTSTGTITLPSAASSTNLHLIIKDEGGNCSVNNLTIAAASGDGIDGAGTTKIQTNFGSKELYSAGGTNWFIH